MKKQQIALQMISGKFCEVLVPIEEDRKKLKEYHVNQILSCEIKGELSPRSLQQIRLYWVLAGKVSDNTKFTRKEDVHEYIKLKQGYTDTLYDHLGQPKYRTKSIAFGNMRQSRFSEYMNEAIRIMAELLNVTEEDLINSQSDI